MQETLKVRNDSQELKGELLERSNPRKVWKIVELEDGMLAGTHSIETVCRCGKIVPNEKSTLSGGCKTEDAVL